MARIIIAAPKKQIPLLRQPLIGAGNDVLLATTDLYELRRQAKSLRPDALVIDAELEGSIKHIVESFLEEHQSLLIVGMAFHRSYFRQSPYLEFIEKPIHQGLLSMTLKMLVKYSRTVRTLEHKVNKLETMQRNEKVINQAKRALQQHDGFTEGQAHQYLQKRSMELRISKAELADRIIKRFGKKT